jgi:hypothetical protein
VPYSALAIKAASATSTPRRASRCRVRSVADNKACECGAILRGVKKPTDCKVFGTVCTPGEPDRLVHGVLEGACAAHYTYGRYQGRGDVRSHDAQVRERRAHRLRRPVDFKRGVVDLSTAAAGVRWRS